MGKLIRESLKDKLRGPSEEDIEEKIKILMGDLLYKIIKKHFDADFDKKFDLGGIENYDRRTSADRHYDIEQQISRDENILLQFVPLDNNSFKLEISAEDYGHTSRPEYFNYEKTFNSLEEWEKFYPSEYRRLLRNAWEKWEEDEYFKYRDD